MASLIDFSAPSGQKFKDFIWFDRAPSGVTPGRKGFLSTLGDFMTSSGLALQGDVARAEKFKESRRKQDEESQQKFQESLRQQQLMQLIEGQPENVQSIAKAVGYEPVAKEIMKQQFKSPESQFQNFIMAKAFGIDPSEAFSQFSQMGSVVPSESSVPIDESQFRLNVPKMSGGMLEKTPGTIGREKGIEKVEELKQTGPVELEQKVKEEETLAPIKAETQALGQSEKAAELAGRDFLRAAGAADTAFDALVNFGSKQKELTGLKPGAFFGIPDKLTPSQLNEFKDVAAGAVREGAALVARQLIPGVRAVSITKLFEKSLSPIGSTMESAVNNNAGSLRNAFVNILSQNITDKDFDGNDVKIQSVTTDPITGKMLSDLGPEDKRKAINELARQFEQDLKVEYMNRVFSSDPTLLKQETVNNIIANAPRFNSIEEVEASDIPVGTPVVVGGRVGIKR